MRAYNESYLPGAMQALATMMDCGINRCGFTPDMFYRMFLTSGVAEQFEKGNPRYVAGLSGAELADCVMEATMGKTHPANDGCYAVSPEYWAGWVLSYYQWKSGRSFRYIQNNGLDIGKVIALYHPLHEADLDKFYDAADSIIRNHIGSSPNALKKARVNIGLTQKQLAEISGVSLRMTRAYEQGQQSIEDANYSTVTRLAAALHIDASELVG